MQCCLEPLRHHGIGFLPDQCCPKSIKATLHRIFYKMLSGASRTALHRVFTCTMLPQEYQDNVKQDFFFLIRCCMEPLRQHCMGL